MPWNYNYIYLLYVYENHVHRNAMTDIHSMKMTPRRGSRMISKAERRLEKHRRDYMGRIHIYTLLSALSPEYFHLFLSLPIFACIHSRLLPSAISFSPYIYDWARRAQFTSTPPTDYLLLPFQKTIFNRQHFYSNPLYIKWSYWKHNAHLVWEKYYYLLNIINRIIF